VRGDHMSHDRAGRRQELAAEVWASECAPNLMLMDPPLQELARRDLPIRRGVYPREQSNRLSESIDVDVPIERGRLAAGHFEQLDHQTLAQERCRGHPLLVEAIQALSKVEIRPRLREQRQSVDGRIALSSKQRQIVTQHMERDARDRPRGALGRRVPFLRSQRREHVHERFALRPEHWVHIDDRHYHEPR